MQPLFDAELNYQDGLKPIVAEEGREGDLIGSGTGHVTGRNCGYHPVVDVCSELPVSGGRPQLPRAGRTETGDHVCKTNPGAVIETNDGATIWLEAKGFGLRREKTHPEWTLTAALRFETKHPKYAWLNETLGIWEGSFDEGARRATYRAFVVPPR